MNDKHIPKEKNEEYYLNIIEEQKKALKIINKRTREQTRELKKLRYEHKKAVNILKSVKDNLTEPKWKYLTNNQIQKRMEWLQQRIETIKEE